MSVPQYFFISHRNVNIGSTLGYSIQFEKGKPTHVPKAMHAIVLERGCLPCDKDGNVQESVASTIAESAEAKPARPVEPENAESRNEAIEAAMRAIVARNSPKDFTAGGMPSPAAVSSALGWQADAKDIRPLWNKIKPGLVGTKPE